MYNNENKENVKLQNLYTSNETLEKRLFDIGKVLNVKIDSTIIYYRGKNDNVTINDVLNGKDKLVLHIRPDFCNTCIIEAIEKIEKANQKFGIDNVIVLIQSDYYRQLIQTKSDYGIKNNAFGYKNNELFKNLRFVNSPSFFVIKKNFYISNFFIPIEYNSDITYDYFDQISLR